MGKKEVKAVIKFKNDRNRDGLRLAEIKTNSVAVQNALMSCLPLIEDNPCKVVVKNTAGYIFKHKVISFIHRTAHVFRAVREACSSDFDRNKYVGDIR